MNQMPASLRPLLRRLQRRLAIGLFLDRWPIWAAAALLLAGTGVLVSRMFVPAAAPFLPWSWLAPIVVALPVLVICLRRAYRPAEVAALADSLSGGRGALLAVFETGDPAWAESPLVAQASTLALPRVRVRRVLAALAPAAVFLLIAGWVPQRVPAVAADAALAKEIVADLSAAVVELKQQELITPEEEQRIEEEIERIRRGAEERMDASAWEAADALREQLVAGLSEKQDAVKWAQESLARYGAALGAGSGTAQAQAAELKQAIDKLAKSGLLAGASPELRALLRGGQLPTDPAALRALAQALGQYLGETNGRIGNMAGMGREFGRFNPAEFPLDSSVSGPDGDGLPGRGAVNRGRGDAELTWGQETQAFDRFKARPLPPGAPRSPDDWAPVTIMPGAPQEAPAAGRASSARQYDAAAGQAAWRRSLAPRHQSAVKKYFGAGGKK